MKYNIMIANSRLETRLHKIAMDEKEVRKRLANPIRTAESQAEYLQMPRQKQADIKDVGGFVTGISADASRKAEQMISRCMIVYDIDKCTPEKFAEIRNHKEYKRYLYTTHKHTPSFIPFQGRAPGSHTVGILARASQRATPPAPAPSLLRFPQ